MASRYISIYFYFFFCFVCMWASCRRISINRFKCNAMHLRCLHKRWVVSRRQKNHQPCMGVHRLHAASSAPRKLVRNSRWICINSMPTTTFTFQSIQRPPVDLGFLITKLCPTIQKLFHSLLTLVVWHTSCEFCYIYDWRPSSDVVV